MERDRALFKSVWTTTDLQVRGDELAIHALGRTFGPIDPLMRALAGVSVHLPFSTTARWAASEQRLPPGMRDFNVIEPATSLDRFGSNLANAYHTLKNDLGRAHWEETLDYIQLGLGMDVEDVAETVVDAAAECLGWDDPPPPLPKDIMLRDRVLKRAAFSKTRAPRDCILTAVPSLAQIVAFLATRLAVKR